MADGVEWVTSLFSEDIVVKNERSFHGVLCSLCKGDQTTIYFEDKRRVYLQCMTCGLIFVPDVYFLTETEEKKEYDHHQNSPHDERYRFFLSRLFLPLRERLAEGSRGLDFGSGPGPTLSVMFEEAGFAMDLYDRFYAPDPAVFMRSYDFITATEVVEHLKEPGRELDRLWSCLRPGGWLGIMTQWVISRERFSAWHYKEESTHICFYSEAVFRFLASKWRTEPVFIEKDIVLIRKTP